MVSTFTWSDLLRFFLWKHVKSLVYVSPLLANVNEFKQRMTTALETVTVLDCRVEMCRKKGSAHIEHLRNLLSNLLAFKLIIQIYGNKSCFGQHLACLVLYNLTW